jgi:hypothetical protein
MHGVSQSGVDDDFPIVSNPFAGFDSGHASLDSRARRFGDHESTGRKTGNFPGRSPLDTVTRGDRDGQNGAFRSRLNRNNVSFYRA